MAIRLPESIKIEKEDISKEEKILFKILINNYKIKSI